MQDTERQFVPVALAAQAPPPADVSTAGRTPPSIATHSDTDGHGFTLSKDAHSEFYAAVDLHAEGYFVKPFMMSALLSRIRTLLPG